MRNLFLTAFIAILLAGCGGGAETNGFPLVAVPAQKPPAGQVPAKVTPTFSCPGPCLYLSDYTAREVYVFAYTPQNLGPIMATLTGFKGPSGICAGTSKAAGTVGKKVVWVVDAAGSRVYAYEYGKTSPTYEVNVLTPAPGYTPKGCSLDPESGNLAVSDFSSVTGGAGNVAIFTPKQQAAGDGGPADYYSVRSVYHYDFLGYGGSGNLFVDGTDASFGKFQLIEFPHGAAPGKAIKLNTRVIFAGQVQFDSNTKWMEVNDSNTAYEFAIAGATGTKKLTVTLEGSCAVEQTWLDTLSHTLFVPDFACPGIYVYNYPAGGYPRRGASGPKEPLGAALIRPH